MYEMDEYSMLKERFDELLHAHFTDEAFIKDANYFIDTVEQLKQAVELLETMKYVCEYDIIKLNYRWYEIKYWDDY